MSDIRKFINLITESAGAVEAIDARPSYESLDYFTKGYFECALWTDEDSLHEDNPAGDVNYYNIDPATVSKMMEDCTKFQSDAADLLERAYSEHEFSEERAGHDFWLTRNGHGAGFWDRGIGDLGEELSKIAHQFGSFDLYFGDDGAIHGS